MKALLLAGGKATRLGHLSKSTPKCLQVIHGEALLDRVVRQLQEAGVNEFLINTHHHHEKVAQHVADASWGSHATLTHEPTLLGTLGTLRENVDFFGGDPGWVLHADNFMSGSLLCVLSAFNGRPDGVWGTMLTFEVDDASAYGVVVVDPDKRVLEFFEKDRNAPSRTASAATFLFDHRVFELAATLPSRCKDVSRDLLPLLLGRLNVVSASGVVIDIGTPQGLLRARALASE